MKVIRFKRPVQIGGTEVTSVTIRPPTVDDEIRAAAEAGERAPQIDVEVRVIAACTGLAYDDLRQAPSSVYGVLKVQLAGFLGSQPEFSVEAPSSSPGSATADSAGTSSGE